MNATGLGSEYDRILQQAGNVDRLAGLVIAAFFIFLACFICCNVFLNSSRARFPILTHSLVMRRFPHPDVSSYVTSSHPYYRIVQEYEDKAYMLCTKCAARDPNRDRIGYIYVMPVQLPHYMSYDKAEDRCSRSTVVEDPGVSPAVASPGTRSFNSFG